MLAASPTASDEFGDDDTDWWAIADETDTLAESAKKMQAAAAREEEIQELITKAMAELKEIARLRKGKGSGRPLKTGRVGTENHNRVSHELARLKRGLLPGENDGETARTGAQLLAAAQHHPADHASAGNTTRHDHAQLRADMWGDLPARVGAGGAADEGAGLHHDDPARVLQRRHCERAVRGGAQPLHLLVC